MANSVLSERTFALERIQEHGPALGAACMVLLGNRNRTWVRRRSETVAFEAYEFLRLSTTLDVVVPEELRDLVAVGDHRMVLPLDVLKKGPLVNFDLTAHGKPASLLQSREVATITAWMLAMVGLDAHEPPLGDDDLDDLIEVCDVDPQRAARAFERLQDRLSATHPQMLAEAEHYRDNYMLLVEMDESTHVLVKYARDERLRVRTRWEQQAGLESTALVVELPSVGFGASYHVEAVVPRELRIMEARLADAHGEPLCEPQRLRDRASLYPRQAEHGAPAKLTLHVRTQRDVLLLPAAVIAGLSTAALAAVGTLAWAEAIGENVSGAAGGVAFVAPSLAAGLVLQRPAAPIVRVMLGWARLALVVVTLATVAAAATMAFGLRDRELGITWVVLATISFVAASILCDAASRAPSDLPQAHGSAGTTDNIWA